MKERTSGKFRESIVIVIKDAQLIILAVLTISIVMGNRVIRRFARATRGRSILKKLAISGALWYMLFDPVRQSLRCTTYVPTIAVAHILVNNITMLKSSKYIFLVAGAS